jgi:hypothetical protein
MLNSFLVPPRDAGNAGNASQPEPREPGIAEEMAQEEVTVYSQALKDAITYLTDNAVNNAGHDVRKTVNIRSGLSWIECDRVIAKATKLVGPVIAKEKLKRENAEKERVEFENLTSLFESFGLQIRPNDGGFDLIGLSKPQIQLIADIFANEGGQ